MSKENISYKKLIKIAFYTTVTGMILTFFFSGNVGIFGTLLIIVAFIMAIIASIQKKKHDKK